MGAAWRLSRAVGESDGPAEEQVQRGEVPSPSSDRKHIRFADRANVLRKE